MQKVNITEIFEELLISAADGWLAGSALSGTQRASVVDQLVEWLVASLLILAFVAPALAITIPLPLAIAVGMFAASIPLAATALLAATGKLAQTRMLAFISIAAALGWLAGGLGGLASPFMLLIGLLPLEAGIVARNRNGVLAGLLATLGVSGAIGLASSLNVVPSVPQHAMLSTISIVLVYAVARGLGFSKQIRRANAAPIASPVVEEPVHVQAIGIEILDRLPGLVTLHNSDGNVSCSGGADKAAFDSWMGSPDGRGYFTRIHVADRITFLNAFDILRRGEPRCRIDLRMERKQGDNQFAHLTVDLMAECDAAGKFCGAVVQSRDVSELVENRSQLSDAAKQAEDANEAKSRFLAAVSHELRTPLNAIIGFSDILAREYFGTFSDERQREYVGLIHHSGHHLLSLVNTMLDMSKIEAGRYELFAESFKIAEAVSSCEAMLGLQASEKGVTLTHRIARGVDELNADRRAVQQILINLVGNAIKFTDSGGVVSTDVELRGETLRLTVSDTGIGMPASQIERIGEPFLQGQNSLSRNYEGTGLGLSLVKGLVGLHGGHMSVESQVGEGTRVMVDLPLDGSGIVSAEAEQNTTLTPVAFPPRLETTKSTNTKKLEMSNDATARIA